MNEGVSHTHTHAPLPKVSVNVRNCGSAPIPIEFTARTEIQYGVPISSPLSSYRSRPASEVSMTMLLRESSAAVEVVYLILE